MKHLTSHLPRLVSKLKNQAGFTMIELLIVIAILGILAVAVLSAINPVEQINRGRDTGTRSDAEQVLSAIDRFNAFKGYFPWMANADSEADAIPLVGADEMRSIDSGWVDDGTTPCPITAKLSTGNEDCQGSNELKDSFINRLESDSARTLYVYNGGENGDSTYVCYYPQSDAFLTEAKERCVNPPTDMGAAEAVICAADNEMICLP